MTLTTPVLTFRLHDQRYGLYVTDVIEVMAMVAIEPLSGAHAAIAGVVNRHGQPMLLIDLRVVTDKPAAAPSASSMFIVVSNVGRTVGLIVDEIFQVLYVSRFIPVSQDSPFVESVFTDERGLVTQMLSIHTLFNRFLHDESSAERG